MHPKTSKLFEILDDVGFWQDGVGYKDMHGQGRNLSNDEKNNKLYKYIIQTEDRLYLIEWLLKRYQKDIFERYNQDQAEKSHFGDNIERIQRIRDIFIDLGVLWMNKYTKGLDYLKVVEGVSGTESSFHIIYTLAKFISESMLPIKGKEEAEAMDTLNDLISCKDTLVNQKLNLFPLDLPRKYELTYEEVQKEVQNLTEEYQERLLQFEDLVMKYQEKYEGLDGSIVYANENTKNAYARALKKFKNGLNSFLDEYKIKKYKVKNMISRMEANKVVIPEGFPELINEVNRKQSEILDLNKLLEQTDLNDKIERLRTRVDSLGTR